MCLRPSLDVATVSHAPSVTRTASLPLLEKGAGLHRYHPSRVDKGASQDPREATGPSRADLRCGDSPCC